MSELELIRRLMMDVPLLFGVISQDYMNIRKPQLQDSVQTAGVLSAICEQLSSIGYLKDFGATPLVPLPPGMGSPQGVGQG